VKQELSQHEVIPSDWGGSTEFVNVSAQRGDGLEDLLETVLLVADGTKTTAEDLRACERLFEGRIPLMGVVLNRAQERAAQRRGYGKA
jgi:translation initiation factor IF-2